MKGRWRPGFGVVSLPEAERGKRLQPRPAPDIPVRPSTSPSPSPSPQTTLGGARRAGGALGGACNRSRGRGRATHHRLHREKVVRPRCAVRLASTSSTHQAARPCQCWSMACTSSLGQLSATSAQPSDPNLGTAPQGSDWTETQKGSGPDRPQTPRLSIAFLCY